MLKRFFSLNTISVGRIIISTNLLILIFHWFWLFFNIRFSNEVIPLHYNVYYGIDWFGPKYYLYLFPLLGTLWLLVGFLLGIKWRRQHIVTSLFLFSYILLLNLFLIAGSFLLFVFYLNN